MTWWFDAWELVLNGRDAIPHFEFAMTSLPAHTFPKERILFCFMRSFEEGPTGHHCIICDMLSMESLIMRRRLYGRVTSCLDVQTTMSKTEKETLIHDLI